MDLLSAHSVFKDNFNHLVRKNVPSNLCMDYRDLMFNLRQSFSNNSSLKIGYIVDALADRGCFLDDPKYRDPYEGIYYTPLTNVTAGYVFLKYKDKMFQLVVHDDGFASSNSIDFSDKNRVFSVVLNYIEEMGGLYSAIPIASVNNEKQFDALLDFLEVFGISWLDVKTKYHFVQIYPNMTNYRLYILSATSRLTPYPTIFV